MNIEELNKSYNKKTLIVESTEEDKKCFLINLQFSYYGKHYSFGEMYTISGFNVLIKNITIHMMLPSQFEHLMKNGELYVGKDFYYFL
jgi:hypothetical protein